MSLRTTILRQSRLLPQQYPVYLPAIKHHIPLSSIARRQFHRHRPLFFPSDQQHPNEPSKPSEDTQSQSTEQNATASPESDVPKSTDTTPPQASSKDIPPPPPKREVDPKDREIAELKDQYLRSVAEFRNLQSQIRREVSASQAFTIQRFATDLLDTIDTLTDALESCPPLPPLESNDPNQREDVLVTEHRNLHEGLRMVEQVLLRTLERHGLTVIPSTGEVLPGFHEVVSEVDGDEKAVGTIAGVIKRGYVLNGKVLRPAKVPNSGNRN